MKITDIKTYNLKAPLKEPFSSSTMTFDHRSSLLVEVKTNEGLSGWGEAGQFGPTMLPKSAIDHVYKPLLLGEDPLNTEMLWEKMYCYTRDYGRKGSVIEGISGIDIALWDIKGKYLGQSVSTLLGGRFRDKVHAYATGLYFKGEKKLEESLQESQSIIERGFKGIKIKVGSLSLEEDLHIVEIIRDRFGDDLLIMVDANHAYNVNSAIKVGRALEKYSVYWFEEPVIPEDIEGYIEVRNSLDIAISGGECEFTPYGFKDLITRRAVDIVQPDVCVAGGFTAVRKIAYLANLFGVHVVPHVWGSAVAMFASLQLIASLPDLPITNNPRPGYNQTLFEYDQSENPLRSGFIHKPLEFHDGIVTISKDPGLGLVIDEQSMKEFIIT